MPGWRGGLLWEQALPVIMAADKWLYSFADLVFCAQTGVSNQLAQTDRSLCGRSVPHTNTPDSSQVPKPDPKLPVHVQVCTRGCSGVLWSALIRPLIQTYGQNLNPIPYRR